MIDTYSREAQWLVTTRDSRMQFRSTLPCPRVVVDVEGAQLVAYSKVEASK